jgi:hypothetical protein
MTTTGVLWNTLFQGDEDNIRKILYGSWLVRDWDFANTSLTGFNPFDDDGNLVDTWFDSDNAGGPWYDMGYLDEKGPDFTPKLEVKPTKVMQSRWPARYDYTGSSEDIAATLMESNPVVDAIYNNLPLSNLQSVGTEYYATSAPVEYDLIWRQCAFIGIDGRSGLNYYIVRLYPKVLFGDFGKTPWNIEEPAALPVKAMCVPDEYTVDPSGLIVGSPRIIFRDGPAWRMQGGPTSWPSPETAPVATITGGTGFTLVFQEPTTPNTPFTYAVSQTTGDTTSAATVTATVTSDSGQVTITGTGLTDADSYTFTVVATGANGTASPASSASNSITAT